MKDISSSLYCLKYSESFIIFEYLKHRYLYRSNMLNYLDIIHI